VTDDIVARLRVLASEFPTVNGWMDNEWKNAADEIERLRAERDEARRFICDLSWEDSREVAKQLGWDCYKETK
jgi:hypothetical protein